MFRVLVIISLILIVLMLLARFLRRVTASFLASVAPPVENRKDEKQDVVYSNEDVVVLRGESKSNFEEEKK